MLVGLMDRMSLCVCVGGGVVPVTGWTPRRTLMLAHWDAGEMSLAGVTEWIEVNRYLFVFYSSTTS